MTRLVILGATGSIGTSTLRVVAAHRDQFQIVGLGAGQGGRALCALAKEWNVSSLALADEKAAQSLGIPGGEKALCDLATLPEADLIVMAIAGMAGYAPTVAAIEAGKDVALATKEVLVQAGTEIMARRAAKAVRLLPLDSEHSAIFQCLQSRATLPACVRPAETDRSLFSETRIREVILTASGGPFLNCPTIDWAKITVEQALHHPRWSMGAKVTIDSATMMNKGLEMIEALHLFNLTPAQLKIWVHPQSLVHSFVNFTDGVLMAQLGQPDMTMPIQYALTFPDRLATPEMPSVSLAQMQQLTFAEPDLTKFPCLRLVQQALPLGDWTHPILTLTNEVAVHAFLNRRIQADKIAACIEDGLARGAAPCDAIVARAKAFVVANEGT
ncbi:MAG: 1-deoxy-D-xylulose-5-phosphate reductoisomerase [Kiritimatiellia bacterium]